MTFPGLTWQTIPEMVMSAAEEFGDADANFTGAALQPLVKRIVYPDCDPCQRGRSIRSFGKEAKTRSYYSADPPQSQ